MEIDLEKYKPSSEQYLEAYKKMLLVRRFEEKCGQLYGMGEIGGFCHLYIGQEAVITAIDMIKQKGDNTITSYRDHAHIILAGTEPKYVLAELMGRATGCSKGKGGSMHLFDVPNKFYGGHGIVGAQVPIGTGLAFAEKYLDTDNICFTFLGDGAVNQGQVYEAFNMAALWEVPVVYIIENNEYSMGTSVERSTFMRELYKKGESFGIKGFQLDGMSFSDIYNGAKQAAEFVRKNSCPLILEVKTYRYRGHSMSDPAKYRSKEEVEQYKERDPLLLIKKIILNNSYADEEALKKIEQEVKDTIKEAVEFAENSPLPDEGELYTNIYCS
ncbi:pyruvate dehydrogenase (acetyl-transferring) E1 component subunit alpha [Rickettsia endosymbiont of Polydrusus tereticollis]|uniref:pyruvate dehydrogenase (acetyl-transferring) E1 component subunit alpha n=1 Tax=Rickettsia endosymbiont of Polydrusus tereticollis TaxID=3066251 RepID=UPI003133480C